MSKALGLKKLFGVKGCERYGVKVFWCKSCGVRGILCVNVCHGDLFATPFVASKPKKVRIKNSKILKHSEGRHKLKTHATKHFAAKTNGICSVLGNFFNFEAIPHGVSWSSRSDCNSQFVRVPFFKFPVGQACLSSDFCTGFLTGRHPQTCGT